MPNVERNSFWTDIFGSDHPVEIEIGPGTGTFLLSIAAERPETNYFAIEHSHSRAVHLKAAAATRNLCNVRVLHGDAACVVGTLVPAHSVAAYHIYFPDPWWKRRHQRRRLFTPDFARALTRTLAPMGRIYVATDVDDVFTLMRATLDANRTFAELANAPSPRTTLTTFERKGLARGAAIHQATFVRSDASSPCSASVLEAHSDATRSGP